MATTSDSHEVAKRVTRWEDSEVILFLESYQLHSRSLRGKELWTAIQDDMKTKGFKKSLWNLEKKWNNLLRKFRSGATKEQFPHFDKMGEILEEKQTREYRPWLVNAWELPPPSDSEGSLEVKANKSREDIWEETETAIHELIQSYKKEIEARNKALRKLAEELEKLVNEPED